MCPRHVWQWLESTASAAEFLGIILVRRGLIPFARTGSLSFTDLNGPPYLWVPGDDQAALYSNGTVTKEQLGEERVNVISGLPGHTPSLRKPEQEAKAGT